MLLVKTKIGPSAVAGTGLFADEFIPAGTPVWKFREGFDFRLTPAQLASLSEPAQKQMRNYCYVDMGTGDYVICADDARFFNHSDTPNVSSGPEPDYLDKALRDIQAGEELTQDYRTFDAETREKLGSAN